MMRVQWVLSANYEPSSAEVVDRIKSVAATWGSHKTWRACSTDNVICHPAARARELLDRAMQAVCNFYVPRGQYEFLKRPMGVRLYEGDYTAEIDDVEDIVAMHLAGSQADIVLLMGFDLGTLPAVQDKMVAHKLVNRHGLIRSAIANMPHVQWVVVDHPKELDKAYQELSNLTCDTMASVLQLLV